MDDNKTIFLPGLNGIRAIAAIGVMLGHTDAAVSKLNYSWNLFGWNKDKTANEWILKEHGVTMFFVLSGFLITYLLLKEFTKTSDIDIKSFYVRRVLRIWPLYYLYFFIDIMILLLLNYNFNFSIVPFYIFFAANFPFIFNKSLMNLDHFWSIGVEEQFYLFWPWFFKNFSKKTEIYLWTLGLFLAVFRILIWYFKPFSILSIFSVVNRFDCMILGGIAAIFYFKKNSVFMKLVNNKLAQFLALFVYFLMFINVFWFLNSIIEIFIVAIATMVIIIGQIEKTNRLINFNFSILDFLGKLSYGIYVIHPIIIFMVLKFVNLKFFSFLTPFIYDLTIVSITIIIAYFSYNFYELPFLKLKSKFSIIKSSNSQNFDN